MYKKDRGLYQLYSTMLGETHIQMSPVIGHVTPEEDTQKNDFNDMACRNIESIRGNLDKLVEKLHSGDMAEAWIYSKITLAANYIDEVTEAMYEDCGPHGNNDETEVIFAIGSEDAM